MNNIDFIKKCIPFAEGFELTMCQTVECIQLPNIGALTYNMLIEDKICYPLLLQRTIEGLMTDIDKARLDLKVMYIFSYGWCWQVQDCVDMIYYETSEEAKRKALEYVFTRIGK